MQFIVHPEIFDRFPKMRLAVVVARGIDNQTDRPQVAARWRAGYPDPPFCVATSPDCPDHEVHAGSLFGL